MVESPTDNEVAVTESEARKGSNWQYMKVALVVTVVVIMVFLFATQRDLYNSSLIALTSIAAGVPTVFSFFNLFQNKEAHPQSVLIGLLNATGRFESEIACATSNLPHCFPRSETFPNPTPTVSQNRALTSSANGSLRVLFVSFDARLDQRLLFVCQRVIIVEPIIAFEFGQLQADLISFR